MPSARGKKLASTVTNSAAPYTSGAYTYSWKANRNYYWRMNFQGTAVWAPYVGMTSYVPLVKVKAVVGKPSCPKSIKAGRSSRPGFAQAQSSPRAPRP